MEIEVQNATYNGVSISGANHLTITRCDFNENGASVAPGKNLLHNLLLIHCTGVTIKDSRFDTSPSGSGIALDHNSDVSISNCEIARNGHYGILISESKNISVNKNLLEANDRSGIMVEYLNQGSENVNITGNIIHYNNGYGLESYSARNSKINNNKYTGNGKMIVQEKISAKKYIVME